MIDGTVKIQMVKMMIGDYEAGIGKGSNKKKAKVDAAHEAMRNCFPNLYNGWLEEMKITGEEP